LDLRLASGAAAGWLAVLACVDRPPAIVLLIGVGAAVGGSLLLIAAVRWRRAAAGALLLFCVALVLIPLAGRLAHARASPLAVLARRHAAVTVLLTVTADPRVLAATGVAGTPRVAVEGSASWVSAGAGPITTDGSILVLADAAAWRDVLPGQRAAIAGDLSPALGEAALSVTLFARGPPTLLDRPPWWQRSAGEVRAALREAAGVLPDQERGLLPGLIDGDTSELDPVLAERFRMAGLTHLVAVSGTNCSLLVGAVLLVLRRARVRPWISASVGGLVLLMFVVVARPSPSVLRAALMGAVTLVSLASGRPRAALPALAAVVLGLLIWQPAVAGGASFTMSVLATAALLVIAPGWARFLRERGVPAGLAEMVAVAAAAHVVTAPVVAAISGRISLVAVPANVLAEPVVAVVTVIGFAAALVAPWWLSGGELLAWLAGWPCRWLVRVGDFFGGLHGATIPWPGGAAGGLLLLATGLVVAAAATRAGVRRVLTAAAATALVILVPVRAATSAWPPRAWLFVACDVGQGDAEVLPVGAGAAVVIDTGPDPVAIDRCLRDLGISRIPLLVLSHFHIDHVGGLLGVVRGRRVDRILVSPLAAPSTGVDAVRGIADRRRLGLFTAAFGTHLDFGSVHLDVLGPTHRYAGTRSDPNNSSVVLRATVGGVRLLLPGDAEVEAQQSMLGAGIDLRADVLKVPHHGSAYSDPDFLAAVHASLGVISVGLHNDYGHPSPVLLTHLARLGVPVLRTDRDGDVAVVGQPGRLTAVVRGVAGSTVGQRSPRPPSGVQRQPPSVADAWMATCRPDRSAPTISPSHCRRSSCWSATRSCSSTAPSARSPPRHVAPTRGSPRPNSPAQISKAPSSTRFWVHRCSARVGCSFCAPLRTYASRQPPCWVHTCRNRVTARSSCCSTPVDKRERRCWTSPGRRRHSRSAAPS
jgi:competence protein ComEC